MVAASRPLKALDLYRGTQGLNTRVDPERLSQGDSNSPAMVELAVAVNVSIDQTGLLTLRRGDVMRQEGEFHSLYCQRAECLVVQDRATDAALLRVNDDDYSLTGLRSGLTKGARMSYFELAGQIYYANGFENGVVQEGVSRLWPVSSYEGPDTNFNFVPAPVGHLIALKRGGICFIAVGDILYSCHEPFAFGLFNPQSGHMAFESKITMICPMESGVFVSDSTHTWWLAGNSCRDFSRQVLVDDAPVIPGTLSTQAVSIGDIEPGKQGMAYFWATREGIVQGEEGGAVTNLTKVKVKYPEGLTTGASHIIDDTLINTTP